MKMSRYRNIICELLFRVFRNAIKFNKCHKPYGPLYKMRKAKLHVNTELKITFCRKRKTRNVYGNRFN